MRGIISVCGLIIALGSVGSAQEFYHARVGVTGTTRLVSDRIFTDITVRQDLAPTLLIGASLPVAHRLNAGLEVSLGTGSFDADEGGVSQELGTLRTATVTLGAGGPFLRDLRWHAGVGVIRYWPSEDTGIFRRGGPTDFLLAGGVDYVRPLNPAWAILGGVRYDYHRFSTDELAARGFTQSQQVHRVGLFVGIARTSP